MSATLKIKTASKSETRDRANLAVCEWRSWADAVIDEMVDGAERLKAEIQKKGSPLFDTISPWRLKEFVSNMLDAQTALLGCNIKPEVAIHAPDPLAGIE